MNTPRRIVEEEARYDITNLNARRIDFYDLSSKGLTRVPDFVFYMKNLEELNLYNNKITVLPTEIGRLKNLRILTFDTNKITSLPPTIAQLKNLEKLYLDNNKIRSFPPEIGQLKNLVDISVSANNLTILPPEIGQLKNLVWIQLRENNLTILPPEIGQLKNLEELDLTLNNLTILPPEIGQLKKLKSLNVSSNNLTTLPPEIGQLKKLKRLDLGDNKLTTLPPEIGQLQKLMVLDLRLMTSITSLPESFKNLPDNLMIMYGNIVYTKKQFMKKFVPKRINKNTELLNSSFLATNNIPRSKRVYLNIPSNVKNNGTLRRVYNKNGINQFIRGRMGRVSLHGNNFTANNVKTLNNKNFNLQRIRVRLLNTPLNSVRATIEGVKNRLPPNVSRTDVNNVVRKIKPLLLNKIRNKLRTTPANNRRTLLNRYKRDGLINNRDVL